MDTASTHLLAIGPLSQRTGCNIETIRYYERIGLLSAPARSAGTSPRAITGFSGWNPVCTLMNTCMNT